MALLYFFFLAPSPSIFLSRLLPLRPSTLFPLSPPSACHRLWLTGQNLKIKKAREWEGRRSPPRSFYGALSQRPKLNLGKAEQTTLRRQRVQDEAVISSQRRG
jgi:hypothetical protein